MKFKNALYCVLIVILNFTPKMISTKSKLRITQTSLRGSVYYDVLAERRIELHIAHLRALVMSQYSIPWLVPANSKIIFKEHLI